MNHAAFDAFKVHTEEELRELVGTPHEAVVRKSVSVIDETARAYIGQASMMFLSTSNRRGQCDVSPRGDCPGFVHVASEHHLVIPERPGNRRADSLSNILENPHVGLLFIIPGMEEVLRVNGRAAIMKGHPVFEELQFKGKAPTLGIVVEVEECFIHCPRALHQAGLWNHEEWLPKENRPSATDIFHAHLSINGYKLQE